jgi:hypothetical protein
MKKPNRNGKQLAVQGEPSVLAMGLLTDDEITALMMQEPLPPNQGFQLPANEEQLTEEE